MPRQSASGKGQRGALRFGLLAVLLLSWGLPCLGQDAAPDNSQTKHWLYCPRCGLEMVCPPQWVNKGCICPRCARRDARMEVTTSPHAKVEEESRQGSPLLRGLVFTMAGGLAVAWLIMKRRHAAYAQAARERLRPAACQVCGAVLKYRECDEGLTGTCPACGETVYYTPPEADAPPPVSDDVKTWHEAMKRARTARKHGNR